MTNLLNTADREAGYEADCESGREAYRADLREVYEDLEWSRAVGGKEGIYIPPLKGKFGMKIIKNEHITNVIHTQRRTRKLAHHRAKLEGFCECLLIPKEIVSVLYGNSSRIGYVIQHAEGTPFDVWRLANDAKKSLLQKAYGNIAFLAMCMNIVCGITHGDLMRYHGRNIIVLDDYAEPTSFRIVDWDRWTPSERKGNEISLLRRELFSKITSENFDLDALWNVFTSPSEIFSFFGHFFCSDLMGVRSFDISPCPISIVKKLYLFFPTDYKPQWSLTTLTNKVNTHVNHWRNGDTRASPH